MANVSFKRGLSTALPSKTAVEGAFYLTTDTNRLYVGKADKTLAELNRYVAVCTYANLPASPAENDFIWISDKNILAVYSGGQWKQINPDTNTNDDTYLAATGNTSDVSVDESGNMKITLNIAQKKKNLITGAETDVAAVPVEFTITADNFSKVTTDVNVGLTPSVVTGGAKIATSGAGANAADEVNIKGAGGASVSVSGKDITITTANDNTTYEFGTDGTTIKLTGNDNYEGTALLKGDNGNIIVSADGTNTIKIAHKNDNWNDATSVTPDTAKTLQPEGTFTVMTSATADTAGHVTGAKVTTFTLPKDTKLDTAAGSGSISADNTGKITFAIKDTNGNEVSRTSGQDLYYTVNGTKVFNQGALDVYTKSDIDTKLKGLNPMVYRGVVNNTATSSTDTVKKELPTSNVEVGDTYMVQADGTYGGKAARTGDLLIASGTESSETGKITTGLTWNLIPSGNDPDTTYTWKVGGAIDAAEFISHNDVSNAERTEVTFLGGTAIDVTPNATNKTIEIKHEDINATITPAGTAEDIAFGGEITAVSSVIRNDQGHVTGITTKKYKLPAKPTDKDTTYSISAFEHKDGKNRLGADIHLVGSDSSTDDVHLHEGQNIDITVDTGDIITVAHETITTTPGTETAQTLKQGEKFAPIVGLTVDNGHITGYKTKEFTLPEVSYVLSTSVNKVDATANTTYNKFTHTSTLTDKENKTTHSHLVLDSSTLKFTAATDGMTVDLVWGNF